MLHRVLLTRDSSDIQLTAMKVVRQIVKSAEESTSRYTKLFHPIVYLLTPKLFVNFLVNIFVSQIKAYMEAFFFRWATLLFINDVTFQVIVRSFFGVCTVRFASFAPFLYS